MRSKRSPILFTILLLLLFIISFTSSQDINTTTSTTNSPSSSSVNDTDSNTMTTEGPIASVRLTFSRPLLYCFLNLTLNSCNMSTTHELTHFAINHTIFFSLPARILDSNIREHAHTHINNRMRAIFKQQQWVRLELRVISQQQQQ